MNKSGKRQTICRDSINGRFITPKEAGKRPATTEKQHLPVNDSPPKRSRQHSERKTRP